MRKGDIYPGGGLEQMNFESEGMWESEVALGKADIENLAEISLQPIKTDS